MKFLIFFLTCGVLCESSQKTDMLGKELETLSSLPNFIEVATEIITPKTRQNDVDAESESLEMELGASETSTPHFTELACTEENTEYNPCGPRCYQTCAFQPKGARQARAVCESASSNGCYPGCHCRSGYVKLNDKCILPIFCPTRACIFTNEEHQQCGTACPITCDSYNRQDEIEQLCPRDICVRGCFCKSGYVRSGTGLCILPTRCPRPLIV